MIGHPDEHDLDRWSTADLEGLRDDLDQALQPEARAEEPQPARPASDAELIDAVRGGFIQAYGQLYERHVAAARSLARHLSRSSAEADDLVSDAFAKVLDTLRAGRGPDSAFRAYLLTALRHTAYDKARRDKRVKLADDVEAVSGVERFTTVPFHDPAVATLERSLASRAFASLPERWQTVLWQTEIEGQSAAELAPLLGLTANGASALAYRAREGLKTAYLQAHLANNPTNRCRATVAKLGAWTRGGLTRRETAQVEAHLDECVHCRALAAELDDVNGTLRAVVAPLVLGTGAAAYLAAVAGTKAGAAGAAAAGTAGAAAGSVTTATSQWIGLAASTTAVVVAVVWGLNADPQAGVPEAEAPPSTVSAGQEPSGETSGGASTPTTLPTTSSGTASTTTTGPAIGTSDPAEPGPPSTDGSTDNAPSGEPLVPVAPGGFAMSTGGPPSDLPITVHNPGRTSAPAPTLVLTLPEGVQVVGPGNNLRGGAPVRFDGEPDQTVGCPAGKGTVTCRAEQDLAAGGSVTFVFRVLAGPKAVGGTIRGTVTAGSGSPVAVEFPVTVTPKK